MPVNSNIRLESSRFSELVLSDDVYVRAHLICFYSILPFFSIVIVLPTDLYVCVSSSASHLSSSEHTGNVRKKD
jgi:hypothetical protein